MHIHSDENTKFFLYNYSGNAGKYTCARISSRTLIINRQSQEENSSNFINNQIMLNNKYNKRFVDKSYSWLNLLFWQLHIFQLLWS